MTTSVTSPASSCRKGCMKVSTAEHAPAVVTESVGSSVGSGESIHVPEIQIACDEDVDV